MSAANQETRLERVLTSRCGHCGETFEPTRPHQRFCRPSCRQAAFTGRRRVIYSNRPVVDEQPATTDPHELFHLPFE
jgi:uncharacterized OB-fold protein